MPHSSGKKKKKREREKIGQYTLGSADWGFLSRFWVFAFFFFFQSVPFSLLPFFFPFLPSSSPPSILVSNEALLSVCQALCLELQMSSGTGPVLRKLTV